MSQVITNAFEQYWQSSLAAEQPVVLDEFILADIPNLDITSPIDPATGLPPESQIVHRQNVDQRGRINNNAVAYTIVMDTTVGDFSFNAMYLRNKANGVIGMIVYKGRETKLKTDQTTGQTGNSLVKSMLMGYDQAAEATLTNVDAGTWQIDYAARLRGMDEDIRQLQADLYGHHTFIGDGFKVVEKDGAYQVTQGVAIVGGLRVELKAPEVIHPGTKPIGVWVDAHRAGSLLSEHQNHFTIITSVADLTDHVDSNGYQHYVAKLATVLVDSAVIDGREVDDIKPSCREAFRRSYGEAGFNLVDGTIEKGAILKTASDVVISALTGKAFSWKGSFPKKINSRENPVDNPLWSDKSYALLVEKLRSFSGTDLIGYAYSSIGEYRRTLGDRCRDSVSMLDFVLDSDVSSNWSPVLQRALDYLGGLPFEQRQELRIPPRLEYIFKETIIWPTDGDKLLDIAIAAEYVTNTRFNSVTKFTYQGEGVFIDCRKGIEAFTEGGIRISGVSMFSLTGDIAINAYNIVSSIFENISIGGFKRGIKSPAWCYYCLFDNCNFYGLKEIGCEVGLLNGTTFHRCRWNKIDAAGPVLGTGVCIKVTNGGTGGKLVGCWLEDTRVGVDVASTPQLDLIGCYIEGVIHPVYSSDSNGGLSRVMLRDCRHTIWHDNSRVAASLIGGQLNVTVIGHRTSGSPSLKNVSFGLRAAGGEIYMNIVDYRVDNGTPLSQFGYEPWKPYLSGVYDYYGTCRKAVSEVDVEVTSLTANELYVTDVILNPATGAALKRDVRSVVLKHAVKSLGVVFSLPFHNYESRFITAFVQANIGSGRAQRYWRGTVLMQSQAGSGNVRASLADEYLSPSLDELSSTRTISGVVANLEVDGENVNLSFTVVSGGSSAPFNVTGLFSISVLNNTSLYPVN